MIAVSLDASWGLIHDHSFLFVDAEDLTQKPGGMENLISPLLTHAGLFLCDVARSHWDNPPSRMNESMHYPPSSHLCVTCLYLFRRHFPHWKGRGRGRCDSTVSYVKASSLGLLSRLSHLWTNMGHWAHFKSIFSKPNLLPNMFLCTSSFSLTRSWPHVYFKMPPLSQRLFDLF